MSQVLIHYLCRNIDYIMPKYPLNILKGRGAQINPPNRFDTLIRASDPHIHLDDELEIKTEIIETIAKSIVNKVDSPDVPLDYSLNPYQGCEHGCIYCYARNTHNYWGYSSGLEFETKIIVKKNAASLLDKKLSSKQWDGSPIMVSGNTDCYQPIEGKYEITRSMLKVFIKHGNPVGLITKNSLLLRDLDLLKELDKHQLVSVAVSINSIDESMRLKLEPRTASYRKRLQMVETLSQAGIPVTVLAAPIIPGLNDHGIMDLVKAAANAGARDIHHIIVRLNGDVADLFEDWILKTFPERADKVLNQIRSMHKGKLHDTEFKHRMRGSGQFAEVIRQQFIIAKNKYLAVQKVFEYNRERYFELKNPQMSLFD